MGTSHKHLFSRAIEAAPGRLHFAAHSHHLWPDASHDGHLACWQDAAALADRKWDRIMGEVWPEAQRHVAAELNLPDPSTVVFAQNTHDFLVRIVSAHPRRPLRILASDGEFHSFRRQAARWQEAGVIELETVPLAGEDFEDRFITRAQEGDHDLVWISHVMFGTGQIFSGLDRLAELARTEGPWIVVDGYHGFMAAETNLSLVADRLFYLAGGYKYAMSGEGVAIMHAPPGLGERPQITGWYAEIADLSDPSGHVEYAADARRFLGATFDPSGLYRFNAVRAMLAQEGLDTAAISAKTESLKRHLLANIAKTPLAAATLLNPPGPGPQARFLAFAHPSAQLWKATLGREDVIVDVRGDVLRIGFGLYHDESDVDALVDALARLPRT
ncbi:aminotransferase class V-fold PLP-dependent enzyme [Novosphingobium pentaromativorans]|uniref:Aminotransferase class V n=1 Tax=Novosphingobium pentaromativorans US6-1 TaxID=1088721 RepID=G6E9F4_9SPHN|nr:aminotransferase class V-fold PLP-dependent enzyme [Novosphingobium pentaromativorans]AIT81038.1 class V aminotransferase [Novosphingobium pentaromativorans US6-1]EHJ62053.1 aminotransferase class V [Novosphingobium pentaromativorans US6-1]